MGNPRLEGARSSFWDRWTAARSGRWLLAIGLLAGGLILLGTGDVRVCQQELVGPESGEVVEVCRSLSLIDPLVVGYILFIVFVALWPDLSEVSIGVVKLTQKLDEQSAKTNEVAEKTERVGESVRILGLELKQTISQEVAQVQTQRQSQNVFLGAGLLGSAREVATDSPPQPGRTLRQALEPVLNQPAYEMAGIPAAHDRLHLDSLRLVRVALVGPRIDARFEESEGFANHVLSTFRVTGADASSYEQLGAASLGHILAVSPTAQVFPVEALPAPSGSATSIGELATRVEDGVREALAAALAWQPDVILMAMGFYPEGSSVLTASLETILERAVQGSVLVAGAGNEGRSWAWWPAARPGVLSVGALGIDGRRATFSNYGPLVDIATPGEDVICLSSVDLTDRLRFSELTGTSISADIVAGAAALLLSTNRVTASDVLGVLRASARRIDGEELAALDADAALASIL